MSYKTYDKLTHEQLEGRRKWYVEFNNEAAAEFDQWVEDDATHWIGDDDAAFQAWTQVHDAKVFPLMLELEDLKAERDNLAASVERLRGACEALIPHADFALQTQQFNPLINGVRDILSETPPAALAEIKAQAVEIFALKLKGEDWEDDELQEFARLVAQSIRQAQEGTE